MVEWYIISIVIAIALGSVAVWGFIRGKQAFGKSEEVERLEQEVAKAHKEAEERKKQTLRTVAFEAEGAEADARGQDALAEAMKKQQRGETDCSISFAPKAGSNWERISILLDNVPVGEVPARHTELFQRILYRSLQIQPAFFTREGAVRLLLTVTYPITPGEPALEEATGKHV